MRVLRIWHALAAMSAIVILGVAGCTTTTYESYRPVRNARVDIAYVALSADFTRYKRLMGDEMGIYFPSHVTPSDQDLDRVRTAFRKSFLSELRDYEIVTKPAADVMQVTASLVDLRNTAADRLPSLSRDINEILEPYKLTFVIEMRDSLTGNVLIRAADTEKTPELDLPEDGSADSSGVEAAAQHWAELLRAFLDKNLRGLD